MASVAVLTAGTVMDAVAALMNDVAKQQYTYAVQIPYLNMALIELRELLELSDAPTVQMKSAVIAVPAGQTYLGYDTTAPQAELPDDFVSPIRVWQRNTGTTGFTPVSPLALLPETLDGVVTGVLTGYVWANQRISFQPANAAIDIKLDYNAQLFIPVTASSTAIGVVNAQSFLQFRTAALCAEFIEENINRATNLNNNAGLALDRVEGINAKLGQAIITRRRPFRAAWKSRGY